MMNKLIRRGLSTANNEAVKKSSLPISDSIMALKESSGIKQIGVVGAGGQMGAGIVQVSAMAGYNVFLMDSNEEAIGKGLSSIESNLKRMKSKNKLEGDVDAIMDFITPVKDLSDLKSSDLVVEAIVENMDIKQKVWNDIVAECGQTDTIFASNTSSFLISEIANATPCPERFIGLHFFNPVPVMKLVEVIKTDKTDATVLSNAMDYIKAVQKVPVQCKDSPGFVVNRVLVPYLMTALQLVDDDVATIEDIDSAMKLGSGVPMGPIFLADYIGLDTCFNIIKGWKDKYPNNPQFFIPKCLEEKVKEGKFGIKSGEGFYNHQK